MSRMSFGIAAFVFLVGSAAAHPSLQDHTHPHSDAASYFTVETLVVCAAGLAIGGTIAWFRRKKENNK